MQLQDRRFLTTLLLTLLTAALFSGCASVNRQVNSTPDESTQTENQSEETRAPGGDVPFRLQSMVRILEAVPDHTGLLVSTAAGFVRFSHTTILGTSGRGRPLAPDASVASRSRAKHFFLRARSYGMRALEINHPGFAKWVSEDLPNALTQTTIEDQQALYWTGVALGSALSVDDDACLLAEAPIAEGFLRRALHLAGTLEEEGGQLGAAEMNEADLLSGESRITRRVRKQSPELADFVLHAMLKSPLNAEGLSQVAPAVILETARKMK